MNGTANTTHAHNWFNDMPPVEGVFVVIGMLVAFVLCIIAPIAFCCEYKCKISQIATYCLRRVTLKYRRIDQFVTLDDIRVDHAYIADSHHNCAHTFQSRRWALVKACRGNAENDWRDRVVLVCPGGASYAVRNAKIHRLFNMLLAQDIVRIPRVSNRFVLNIDDVPDANLSNSQITIKARAVLYGVLLDRVRARVAAAVAAHVARPVNTIVIEYLSAIATLRMIALR